MQISLLHIHTHTHTLPLLVMLMLIDISLLLSDEHSQMTELHGWKQKQGNAHRHHTLTENAADLQNTPAVWCHLTHLCTIPSHDWHKWKHSLDSSGSVHLQIAVTVSCSGANGAFPHGHHENFVGSICTADICREH